MKSLGMSDLPQGAARERAGSAANSSGSAVAVKTVTAKPTASNGQLEGAKAGGWSGHFVIRFPSEEHTQ